MTERRRKIISWLIAAPVAVIYAAVFSAPYEIAQNGTIDGNGMGRAIEMLFVGAVVYWAIWFLLRRRADKATEATE